MGEISGNVGVHGDGSPVDVTAGVSGRAGQPPLDVSIGIKDAAFAIGGIVDQPLVIDLGPIDLVATGDEHKPITVKAGLNLTGEAASPITVNAGLIGDKTKPVTFDATIAAGLDNIGLTLKGDPNNPVSIDLGLDDIKIDLGLDDIHACLSLGITQIPNVQVHMPTSACVGLSLLGIPIFNFSFQGQWGLTTQDNPPRIFQGHPRDQRPRNEAGDNWNMPDVTVSLEPEP